MKFIDQGPNIPEQLLRDHSEGRVVFFCGAGISYPAGLPVFRGLVEEVYAKLGEPFTKPTLKGGLSEAISLVESMLGEAQVTGSSSMKELHNLLNREASNRGEPVPEKPDERTAFTSYKYDQTLNLLEHRIDFKPDSQRPGQSKMRMTLLDILKPKKDRLSVHHALLHLSRHDGKLRLVTTNFDHLFELAHAGIGPQKKHGQAALKQFAAPMLPSAKPTQWDGLVYLHGRLPNKEDDSESQKVALTNLVLTSGDFGRGYLTERWATRFINEIFHHYTVCFVGYSIEDPVMRYMMDAINADASKGEVVRKPYAFAGFTSVNMEQTQASWEAKGVEPILYGVKVQEDGKQDHSKLYDTLTEWSDKFTGGVSAKVKIIQQYASLVPTETTKEDLFVEQVVWALTDSSGSAAKAFAEHKPTPPLEWLDVFLKSDKLSVPTAAGTTDDSQQVSKNLLAEYAFSPRLIYRNLLSKPLVDWLGEYVLDVRLLYSLAGRGELSSAFLNEVEKKLVKVIEDKAEKASLPIVKLWQLVFAGKLVKPHYAREGYAAVENMQRFGYQRAQKVVFKKHFEPKVRMKNRDSIYIRPEYDIRLCFDVTLQTHFAQSVVEKIPYHKLSNQELVFLAADAITLIDDAVELWQELTDNVSRLCVDHMPSIDASFDSELIDSWTALIRVTRDAWSHYNLSDGASAASLPRLWVQSSNPVKIRLALFAASKSIHITPDEFIGWLCDSGGHILRSKIFFRETMRLLDERSCDITDHHAQLLIECLLDDTSPDDTDLALLDKENIWLIVARLIEGGRAVGEAALELYRSDREENWKSRSAGQWEEFPYKIDPEDESIWGKPIEFQPPPEIPEQLPQWIRMGGSGNQYMDYWYDYCENNIQRAVEALAVLAAEGEIQFHYWRAVLVTGRETFGRGTWNGLACFIQKMPDELFSELSIAIAELMRRVVMPNDLEDQMFMSVIRRLIDIQLPDGASVEIAIAYPSNVALDALIKGWSKQGIEEGQGLPGAIRPIFEQAIQKDPLKAISILARVVLFYDADPHWTRQILMPLFRSDDTTVKLNAWKSFLIQPRFHHLLFKEWVREFTEVSIHYSELGRFDEQYASILTFAAISLEDCTKYEQTLFKQSFQKLPSSALCQSIVVLQQQYGNAMEETKPSYWSRIAQPFFESYWPEHSQTARNSEVSVKLLSLLLTCKDEFEVACNFVVERLHHIDSLDYPLDLIEKHDLARNYPDLVLEILERIIGHRVESWTEGSLARVLQTITDSMPILAQKPSYKRLRGYVSDPSLPS